MGQALYRKYRSKSLDEVVGQEHVTQTLSKALDQGRLSHAYLFTGPRGVGKTSVARILAHQINDLPYDDDSAHIDIIEIDAASNRRIDEIRDIRDKVYIAPAAAKYKVYIIDEVHMLTREAFNALLKTLEEPPAHVIFILATTDAHKLPETIISRTQRFSFKPADQAKLVTHLKSLAKSENIDISDAAIELIAEHGGGSYRDSISLLDQAASQGGKVDAEYIQTMLGVPPSEAIEELLNHISGGQSADLMQNLVDLYTQGYQANTIATQIGKSLREKIVDNSNVMDKTSTLDLLRALVEVPASHEPERALEIILLKANPALFETVEPIVKEIKQAQKTEPKPEQNAKESEPVAIKPEPVKKVAEKPAPKKNTVKTAFNEDTWPNVLAELKKKYNTLYGIARMGQPDFSETGKLRLAFSFSFHQKRLNEDSSRKKILDIIHDLTGENIELECIVDKTAQAPQLKVPSNTDKAQSTENTEPVGDVKAISNIFGGAEVLES